MPPVFGPRSPSKARLWSCAVPSGMRGRAVAEGEEARLLADEAFLDDELGAGRPERASEHGVDRRLGFGDARRDDDALAGGEAVRLDDDRRAPLAHIGLGGVRLA